MSTAEKAPQVEQPAALPAIVAAWLAPHPDNDDTAFSVERWGDDLELTAERGPWRLWINAEGRTAGLECKPATGDMGREWAHALGDLAELLAAPRVRAVVEAHDHTRRLRLLAARPEGGA